MQKYEGKARAQYLGDIRLSLQLSITLRDNTLFLKNEEIRQVKMPRQGRWLIF